MEVVPGKPRLCVAMGDDTTPRNDHQEEISLEMLQHVTGPSHKLTWDLEYTTFTDSQSRPVFCAFHMVRLRLLSGVDKGAHTYHRDVWVMLCCIGEGLVTHFDLGQAKGEPSKPSLDAFPLPPIPGTETEPDTSLQHYLQRLCVAVTNELCFSLRNSE